MVDKGNCPKCGMIRPRVKIGGHDRCLYCGIDYDEATWIQK